MTPLPTTFFEPSASIVAPALLGLWLVRLEDDGGFSGGIIVETEAYLANDDPACHAARGRTARNRSMWGPPGRAYVYFIYGVHHCFNAVCQPEGIAEAVLVRAIEPLIGLPHLRRRRPGVSDRNLANGPGKLCAALGMDAAFDGYDLGDPASQVFIADNAGREELIDRTGPVTASTRIGLTKAAELPLRFLLPQSPFISRRV
jgi:DNA-3-methyladenine glycosylase